MKHQMPKTKHQIVPNHIAWGIRSILHSIIAVFVATLLIAAVYLTQEYGAQFFEDSMLKTSGESISSCNVFSGKWVFDNQSYPLYKGLQCTYMSDQLACDKFGRKDLSFQNWRWQPHQCDLLRIMRLFFAMAVFELCGIVCFHVKTYKLRFNATALLERLRDKRLVYVGDSLNRNQWVSMVCLVESAVPPELKSMQTNGSLTTFKAIRYNATIEFYWAPLLVESNSDHPVNHRLPDRIVRVQAIEKHARHWTDADYLVFNSYLWWRRSMMNVLWGSFESADGIYKEVEMLRVYEMALKTWSDWLEVHVNPNKTKLFFVSMSPTHQSAEEWGGTKGENCYSETEPVTEEGYWGNSTDPIMLRVVENALDELKTRGLGVQMLNITQLSEYRKEGHPSIYRKQWDVLTEEQVTNPSSFADCIHWCLPGVPDVWNELLYSYIFSTMTS